MSSSIFFSLSLRPAVVLADLGLRSFDDGRAYGWDAERREAVPADAWLVGKGYLSGRGTLKPADTAALGNP